MTIDMPGNSSVAYANYASVVKSVYEQAWVPPDNAQNDDANVKVTVTIARDGTVISARVLTPSGDAGVDASVQRTLDRVTFIAPVPGRHDGQGTDLYHQLQPQSQTIARMKKNYLHTR